MIPSINLNNKFAFQANKINYILTNNVLASETDTELLPFKLFPHYCFSLSGMCPAIFGVFFQQLIHHGICRLIRELPVSSCITHKYI